MKRAAVVAGLLLMLSGCLLRRERPVADYLSRLTGPDFIDCGSYVPGIQDWEAAQKTVLDCAMNAIAQRKRFQFQEHRLGIDAPQTSGLIGTSGSGVLRYHYAGRRSGSLTEGASFTSEPCPKPNLYTQGPWLRFGCGETP